ncbi:MAG: type II toxin-antitoxin system prevent-host-death family antitoxin [Acidobacteriota bacterium]|nr:type II toxin-antitoxin system prevent-host-death family antitoxin [Acidobacteriota bacterium]
MRFINVRELKAKASEILKAAADEEIVVTSRGKPIVVIRGVDDEDFELAAWRFRPAAVRETQASYGEAHEKTSPIEPPVEKTRSAKPETIKAGNPLKAVFWDYPELTDENVLAGKIRAARKSSLQDALRWFLARFLERGRAVDTLRFFTPEEIRRHLPSLKISPRAVARWTKILESYARP